MHPHLAFMGGGAMAGAIIRGGLRAGLLRPERISVAELDAAKRAEFAGLGVETHAGAADALDWLKSREDTPGSGQIVLAVKPQSFAALAGSLRPVLGPDRRVIISVLAGIPSTHLRAALSPRCAIVRAMPNTPAAVGRSATAICLGAGAEPGDEAFATKLFSAVGRTVVRVEESMMNAVTALSGSGPAYVYLLIEAMSHAGEKLGLPKDIAALLAKETVVGAGALLAESGQTPETLRLAVTSKGGTTEAALAVLHQGGFEHILASAMTAARDRGSELAKAAEASPV